MGVDVALRGRDGKTRADVDADGRQLVSAVAPGGLAISRPLTSYGELQVASVSPVVQVAFTYGILAQVSQSILLGSGSATTSAGLMTVDTTAATSSSARVESVRFVKYRPGQGALARFDAGFTGGAAGCTLLAGVGSVEEGFFFASIDGAFGVLHRTSGVREVQTLTVSTGSGHDENITITLAGDAKADVDLDDTSSSTSITAAEIAAADYSAVGDGWDAFSSGATVVFVSRTAGDKTGTFSLSSATSAVGAFAETTTGVAADDTNFTKQVDWNQDRLDGKGGARNPSGMKLDTSKLVVYEIQYQWGAGDIYYEVENTEDGHFVVVHIEKYNNANTSPSLRNPSMPVMWEALNSTNSASATVFASEGAAFIEGEEDATLMPRFGAFGEVTSVTTSVHHVVSIRNRFTVGAQVNRAILRLLAISGGVEHNKTMTVHFYVGPTFSTPAIYADVAPYNIAQTSTTTATLTGGTEVVNFPLGRTGTITLLGKELNFVILPGQALSVGVSAQSGTTGECAFGTTWLVDL